MRGRGVLATALSALLLPLLMNAIAHAGTDTGVPGIVVTSPSPSGFTSYGGIRLQAIGVTGPTFDEWLGVGDLTPTTNRVETNFNPASFLLNGNSGNTAVDCTGNYGVGTTASPVRNALTLTWDATANTLTSRFVTPTLDCTTLFRNFAQELANAKGWTLARAQTALTDVNALRILADDRQSGTVLTMTGGSIDGATALGTFDPGAGASNTWLATDYDFDSPNGFTVSGNLNLGGAFGTCEATCALELKFGHFTPPNRPPVVDRHASDATGAHGSALATGGSFTDPDGDPLLITGTGAGDVTDNHDGTWSWLYVPQDDGSDAVSVTASDGKGGTATDTFTWTAVDTPPVVDQHAADATGGHHDTLTTHGSFTDPDGDPLSISGSGAGDVTDNEDGTWSWTYHPSGDGSGTVTVTASDGFGGSTTDSFTWTAGNAPPVVLESAADADGGHNDTLTTHGSFTDPDGDPLSISGSGAGDVTDHEDGTWSWSYDPSGDGSGSVTVTASDGNGGSTSDSFDWVADDHAPEVSQAATDVTGHDGDTLTMHGAFHDPDGDPLAISGSGAGTVTGHSDGTWTWRFVPSQDGTASVTVTASDGYGGTATDTFTWTAANASPTVAHAAADATGNEGDTLTASGSFTDPDGDPISISGSGAGHVADHHDGTWSWSFTPNDDGNGSVEVTASDGFGGTVTDTFTWSSANVAPSIVSLVPDATKVLSGADVTWTAVATDPGAADTFTWWFDGGGGFAGGLRTTYTRSYDDCGTYALHARIEDDDGGSAQATSDATVTVVRAAALSPVDPSGTTAVNIGQVLPVKVFVGCGGFQGDLQPSIDLLFHGESYEAETTSSADRAGVMRANQGQYQYNLRVPRSLGGVDLVKGDLVTVRVRPFGPDGGALRIVLQIRK
jgi:Bacterial Ig domain